MRAETCVGSWMNTLSRDFLEEIYLGCLSELVYEIFGAGIYMGTQRNKLSE